MEYKGYQDTDLIPELVAWKEHNYEHFDIEDWMQWYATPELAIGFSLMFCPELEECDGYVFFKDSVELESMNRDVHKYHNGDFIKFQSFVNHMHIADYIKPSPDTPINAEQVDFIGKVLEKIWGYQLKAEFPHLDTVVKYYGLDVNTLEDANVTFWAQSKDKA